MKRMRKIIRILLLCLVIVINFSACNVETKKVSESNTLDSKKEGLDNLEGYVKGFWLSNRMEEESIMLVYDEGELAMGNLLFEPIKIVELVTYNPDTKERRVWNEGIDYRVDGKTIVSLSKELPSMSKDEVMGQVRIAGFDYSQIPSTTSGLYLPFTEGTGFTSKQIYVTYEYEEQWDKAYPAFMGDHFPNTMSKLKNKEKLNLLVYGDSISTGANSTGYMKAYPYKESWPIAVAANLSSYYGTNVDLLNKSVGGWTSENAIKSMESIGWVNGVQIKQGGIKTTLDQMPEYMPDLVILGFGMNDATNGINKKAYELYMNKIISSIRERNSECEFILLGTMLANEEALNQSKDQISYYSVLETIASNSEGMVSVNIGQMHQDMLDAGKKYIDMTGNNVNHPNDYMASIYAMNIIGLLTE